MTTMSDSPEIELLHRAAAQAYLASRRPLWRRCYRHR
jgi:hypothetical protein